MSSTLLKHARKILNHRPAKASDQDRSLQIASPPSVQVESSLEYRETMATKTRTATPTAATLTIENETHEADRSSPGISLSQPKPGPAVSPNEKTAARNTPKDACVAILETLGKAPLPSLRSVTTKLIATIQNTKGVLSSNEGWQKLADGLCRFQYLVNTVAKCDSESQGKMEKTFHNSLKQIDRTLRDMGDDLRKAQELGNDAVRAFFTADPEDDHSIAAYMERIEEPIESLKNALCRKACKEEELEEQLNHVSDELKKEMHASSNSTQPGAFALIGNLAEENEGNTFAGMRFFRGMDVKIQKNTATKNKKDVYANIEFVD